MTKKAKVIIVSSIAITAIVVAFLYKSPKTDSAAVADQKSHTEEDSNVDHTISADMQIHQDSTPVIKVTSNGVEAQSEKWETSFFNNYLEDTYKGLPTRDQTKGLKDIDVHHDPSFIMETGLRLGKIKKQVKLNEAFAPQAMEFYRKCAAKEKGFTPIRGLCLANLIYLKKQKNEELDLSAYPEKVRSMAEKAMEFQF